MRVAFVLVVAAAAALLGQVLAVAPAYADHESRNRVLGETGLDMALMILLFVGVVLVLGAFAAVILWWERKDTKERAAEQKERASRS